MFCPKQYVAVKWHTTGTEQLEQLALIGSIRPGPLGALTEDSNRPENAEFQTCFLDVLVGRTCVQDEDVFAGKEKG